MKQFLKFGIVGVSNTVISYFLYIICLWIFQRKCIFQNIDYIVASVIAFLISVLWSFYWNNRFTFKRESGVHRSLIKALLKTYASYSVTGLFLHNMLLSVSVELIGIPKTIAYMLNLCVTIPLNFLLNKYWAFRDNTKWVWMEASMIHREGHRINEQ